MFSQRWTNLASTARFKGINPRQIDNPPIFSLNISNSFE